MGADYLGLFRGRGACFRQVWLGFYYGKALLNEQVLFGYGSLSVGALQI